MKVIFIQMFFVLPSIVQSLPNGYVYENPKTASEFSDSPSANRAKSSHQQKNNEIWLGVGETVNSSIERALRLKTPNLVPPFPDSGRQHPILESPKLESLPIQADIKYGNLQSFVANLLHPKPIIDTIQEHEKYGNDGDKSRGLGIAVVNAFEGLSNTINDVINIPYQTVKTKGRHLTAALNQVGGKLVGLAK